MIQGLERVDRGLQRAGLETRETEVGAVEDASLLVAALPYQEDRQVAVLLALRAIRGHLEAVVAAIRPVARVRFRNECSLPSVVITEFWPQPLAKHVRQPSSQEMLLTTPFSTLMTAVR